MKDNLVVVLLAGLVILLGAGVTTISIRRQDPYVETRARLLNCDPSFYQDKRVRLKTEGMQKEDNQLIYREKANEPPIVVCRFPNSIPEQLPKYVQGLCIGRRDGVVLVVDCSFSD